MRILALATGFLLVLPSLRAQDEPALEQVFLTLEEALRIAFPEADEIKSEARALSPGERERVERRLGWRLREEKVVVHTGEKAGMSQGYALVMNEIGKSRPITFLVKVEPDGRVGDVAVMVYRESIGSEVRQERFRRQFRGKSPRDRLRVGRDIRNITGASLSCRAMAAGVKKALVIVHELYLRPEKAPGVGDGGQAPP